MIFKLLACIYTAGATYSEAARKMLGILERKFSITSDILGEFTGDIESINAVVKEYCGHIVILGYWQRGFKKQEVSLAVKPSRIGLEYSYGVFRKNLHMLAEVAKKHGVFLWVDAEKREDRYIITDLIIRERALGFDNVGAAIQCVHSDAKVFLEKLLKWNIAVRFVKGAYTDCDLKKDADIVVNYMDCFWTALYHFKNSAVKSTVAVATHDKKLIDYALRFREIDPDVAPIIQIQMLYGIRVKLQRELIALYPGILIYVPWGSDRIGFLKRRLKEGIHPSAIWLFLRNIFEALRYNDLK
ncbi:MAG: proline dehydrogenase family protein [bacterium]|nr:proline dehydrogenase family protein [bacterium]